MSAANSPFCETRYRLLRVEAVLAHPPFRGFEIAYAQIPPFDQRF